MSTSVFRENIEHIVKVELTDAERLAVGGEMAQAYADKDDLDAGKKLAADGFKRRIEAQEAVITRNGELLRKGYREETMECEKVKDYGLNTLTIRRLDTGAVVASRELNEDEQQMDMPVDEEPDAGEGEEDADNDAPGYVPDPPDLDTSEMDGDPETPDPLDDGPED